MILYHYTAIALAESIFNSGLTMGHLRRSSGEIEHGIIWLTDDPTSVGHGLLTGSEVLSDKNIRYIEKVERRPVKNKIIYNKMQIRLSVDVSGGIGQLCRFVEWAKIHESIRYAKRMGLSAAMDLSKVKGGLTGLAAQKKTKEKTWWLHFGPIGPEFVLKAEVATDFGWEPYDFERHGREAMYKAGQVVVAQEQLGELQELFNPLPGFELIKAFAICVDPNVNPQIHIRGGGNHFMFDIETGECLYGGIPHNAEALKSWLVASSEELLRCWEEAVDQYYVYYPDAGHLT